VVGALLEIPQEAIDHGLRRQFQGKPKAIEPNLEAVNAGYQYVRENLPKKDRFVLRPMAGRTDGLVLVEGNQAAALGALMGGVTVVAWYPITPSSSLCEA